jgi:hypothetical protein
MQFLELWDETGVPAAALKPYLTVLYALRTHYIHIESANPT